jgi:DNA-binding transcriptional ArsR family regulator
MTHRRGGGLTCHSVRGNLPFVETYELVLDALGDRTRRQIVQVLRGGPVAVGELAERIPVSRPAISQHLKVLQACRLVGYESVGTRHLYRLDPAGVRELRAWLDDFWGGALEQFARYAVEQAANEPPASPVTEGDGS